MVQSVLGSITLGYRPLWDRARALCGLQLFVGADPAAHVDAPHLLRTLDGMWTASAPPLLLCFEEPGMLLDTLQQAQADAPMIAVEDAWLDDVAVIQATLAARRRGVRLVWRGDVRRMPQGEQARCFVRCLLSLQPEDAAAALQVAWQLRRYVGAPSTAFLRSPVQPGHFYEDIASGALVNHCLDQCEAVAIAGWPDEEVLNSTPLRELTPARSVIERLLRAIKREQSIDVIEDILSEEPLLSYRFLTAANSAALGLRTGVDSLRRGLLMLGFTALEKWLVAQLPSANSLPNLQPVRSDMVLRAQLMGQILDAGVENDLRREVHLCGLFAELDLLMQEPLASLLRRLPLSDRIFAATLADAGPYAPALAMARALAGNDLSLIRQLRHAHELDTEDLNRALLRTLVNLEVAVPAPLQPGAAGGAINRG